MLKYYFFKSRHYIVIFLTTITLFFVLITNSFSKVNNFFVNNIYVSEDINLNFSRDQVIDKNFRKAFEELMFKVLLSKDFNLLKNVENKDMLFFYFGASYNLSDAHRFEFYALGAPQRHGQNLYKQKDS